MINHSPCFCPKCNNRGDCVDSRSRRNYRYRHYKCQVCPEKWSSIEVMVLGACGNRRGVKIMDFIGAITKISDKKIVALSEFVKLWRN